MSLYAPTSPIFADFLRNESLNFAGFLHRCRGRSLLNLKNNRVQAFMDLFRLGGERGKQLLYECRDAALEFCRSTESNSDIKEITKRIFANEPQHDQQDFHEGLCVLLRLLEHKTGRHLFGHEFKQVIRCGQCSKITSEQIDATRTHSYRTTRWPPT